MEKNVHIARNVFKGFAGRSQSFIYFPGCPMMSGSLVGNVTVDRWNRLGMRIAAYAVLAFTILSIIGVLRGDEPQAEKTLVAIMTALFFGGASAALFYISKGWAVIVETKSGEDTYICQMLGPDSHKKAVDLKDRILEAAPIAARS